MTLDKIKKLNNGILVATSGDANVAQHIVTEEIFFLDENGELTKKHIVKNIMPKLLKKLDENNGFDKDGYMEVSIMFAYKDKLYKLRDDLIRADYAKIGSGMFYVDYAMYKNSHLPPKQRLLSALVQAAKRDEACSGPFVLIDTIDQKYEVCDLGGKNY